MAPPTFVKLFEFTPPPPPRSEQTIVPLTPLPGPLVVLQWQNAIAGSGNLLGYASLAITASGSVWVTPGQPIPTGPTRRFINVIPWYVASADTFEIAVYRLHLTLLPRADPGLIEVFAFDNAVTLPTF